MEAFHHITKLAKYMFFITSIFCCFIVSATTVAEQYRLDVIAELPTFTSSNIVTVVPLPAESNNKNENQYLLADTTGALSILKDTRFNAISRLPLSDQPPIQQIKLTALTLHPSFSSKDQSGYQTFFTAHIEPTKTNNNVARLTIIENPKQLPFDAVITQWKFDHTKENHLDTKQRREVMRIAVPTNTHQIQQVAFNPYSKSWHDDYGLMHIALSDNKSASTNYTKNAENALYSGVILRINPAKFGLRNYIVPNDNPFMKKRELNNEIFILGAQKISFFAWSKQYHTALLIQHMYNNNQLLVIANRGADWRQEHQDKNIFSLAKNQGSTSKILPYNGRNLKSLSGHLLYLSNSSKYWQLSTIDTPAQLLADEKQRSLHQETIEFGNNVIPSSNKVKLLFNHHKEPLLLDITDKKLYLLTSNKTLASTEDKENKEGNLIKQPDTANTNAYGVLLLILLVMIILVLFYRLRPRNNNVKAKLRSQFARFDINEAQTVLSFYKRHKSEVCFQLAITDIVESEISLNNASLSVINKNDGNGYNPQRENELRASFQNEHRHKLINDEVRQVHLCLTDKHGKIHIVCLYLRKGNQRLTKAKYLNVLESIIDWSWLVAAQLNPHAMGKREIKVTPAVQVVKSTKSAPPIVNELPEEKTTEIPQQVKDELHNIAIHDSQLISSLDKLVNLKQQGFLNEEEFSLAKAKILSDITQNK
jgi:hypothetical protein